MRFTVLRSKTVSRQICDKQSQTPPVNYMPPSTRQLEIQNSMFQTLALKELGKSSLSLHG